MTTENIVTNQVQLLQKSKGDICISIILPTHRLSPERRVDNLELKRLINAAKQMLQYKYSVSNIQSLMDAMDAMYQNVDFNHNSDGLGLYISPTVRLAVQFPFPVEEKVMVGDSFEIRDLMYKANYSVPYLSIVLARKEIRLYNGIWDELTEIADENFPKTCEEEYLYNPPSRGTPFTGHTTVRNFEREKSSLEEIRYKGFYHQADERLNHYVTPGLPIILLGVEKDIAWYEKVSIHSKNIISKIEGNYEYSNHKQLADSIWPVMFEHLQNERNLLIKSMQEKVGEHLVISGIQDVWQATKDGKALKLLVEKDFRKSGFITDGGYQLHERPTEKAYKIVADAVDDVMEMVLDMGGEVFFTDNDLLRDYEHIALITRY